MKSRRGVRLPTAPPTSKHKDKSKYVRKHGTPQNWRDYLDMERWEAQERLDELARMVADDDGMTVDEMVDEYLEEVTEQRSEREPADDDYETKTETERDETVYERD